MLNAFLKFVFINVAEGKKGGGREGKFRRMKRFESHESYTIIWLQLIKYTIFSFSFINYSLIQFS